MLAPQSLDIKFMMLQHVNDSISSEILDYLRRCGISEKDILQSTRDTRLFHDLNIYGDVAEACVETLELEYSVDMSSFEFDRYFPSEYIGETPFKRVANWFFPLLGRRRRMTTYFEPIRLSDLEMVIERRSWSLA